MFSSTVSAGKLTDLASGLPKRSGPGMLGGTAGAEAAAIFVAAEAIAGAGGIEVFVCGARVVID